ncbi:phage tail length tape measure family protein [Aliihoeflea sp. 40Bstr573]|uniref:phage tail length tape measure family protein n=1 Tax=Aliihoeflea sp. 40Bstr573 TaxID=2696467 RepID=UPI0020960F89|nr:phage tail length tape measure family protein [Aliihoeflea sp. 40Bstr573]MCO6386241.1 hypothetical protein [Aliihoeflea sp. 40Bstr573]
MAVEAERLLAVFEARFSSLEKALTKARNDSSKAFTSIEKDAARAENALAGVGSKGVPGIDKATKAIGRTRFETANLAAQFNDIGVQLAGGQSPFLIAVQQGAQINQVLGQAGARGAVSMLGGAFASLLNPVSLATIAVIGLGGAAVQYFASMMDDGAQSEESLKRQVDLIRRVADTWGDAVPELREYANELQRIQEQTDRITAGDNLREALYQPLEDAVNGINAAMAEYSSALQEAGVQSPAITELRNAFSNLREELEAGTADAEDAELVQSALNETMKLGVGDATGFADALAILAGQLQDVADRANAADSSISALNDRGGIPYSEFGGGRGSDPRSIEKDDYWRGRYLPDPEAPAKPDRSAKSARDKAAAEAQRERDAVQDLIENLQFERSLIGMTAVEKEKANALRRAGTAATDEEAQQIMTLVEATYTQREALKNQEEAYKQLQRAGETAINGLMTAMADGKIEAEELLSILLSVAQQLMSMKGGGGSILSALFGGGGGGTNWNALSASGKYLFDSGGYTGPGGRRTPAGVVHKGEVVWSQRDIARAGGVGVVEAMRRGLRGYENGGAVRLAPSPARLPASGAETGAVTLRIINEEGPMFRTTVRTEAEGVSVQVVEQNNKALANWRQNGGN